MGFASGFRNALQAVAGPLVPYPRLDEEHVTGASLRKINGDVNDDPYFSLCYIACELAKSRPVSTLPVHVYYTDEEMGRIEAVGAAEESMARLLQRRWNPLLRASEGLRWTMLTKDTLGTAYVRVEWSVADTGEPVPVALWPMTNTPETFYDRSTGRVAYRYGGDDFTAPGTYLDHEVCVFKSSLMESDGHTGRSLAEAAAKNIGLSIDLEDFYRRLLDNGSHFPSWLECDSTLNTKQLEDLTHSLEGTKGILEAGAVRIFPHGIKVKQSPLTMGDMSLVKEQEWVLQQMCRITGVPPTEVYDLSRATYSNTEQAAIQFSQKTLVPECRELEYVFDEVLANAGCAASHVKWDINGMLRGEYKSRMEGYQTGIYAGFFTRNDVRVWEELEALPGLDEPLIPVNYNTVGPDGEIKTVGGAVTEKAEAPGSWTEVAEEGEEESEELEEMQ